MEYLPKVLNKIHDTPGETGLSPYEILFGRERFCAGVPYRPPTDCEDAQAFLQRQHEVDEKVAVKLNEIHKTELARRNVGRKTFDGLPIGTKVWYRRPPGSGGKLDTRWMGPGEILAREGDHSYVVEIGPTGTIKAERAYLKEYKEDSQNESPKPMFYHRRTVAPILKELTHVRVNRITGHTLGDDGKMKRFAHK